MKRQRLRSALILGTLIALGFGAGRMLAVGSPHLMAALDNLHAAAGELERADSDKGGHRAGALRKVLDAITEVQQAVTFTGSAAATPNPSYTIVRVYYGTNRTRIDDRHVGYDYDARQTALSLGTATVSIPKDHDLGYWEKPIIDAMANRKRDVILLTVIPQGADGFVAGVRERIERSKRKEAFVFVHGFNTTFRDAIQRTAILAYDLKFDGAPIAFTWPSRAQSVNYASDEEAAQASVKDLEMFLRLVATETGAARIHLIAHSMGNRILLQALQALQERNEQPTNLTNLVLTAPDVNVTYFRQLMSTVDLIPKRVTLYASTTDRALNASRDFHDFARAGQAGNGLVLLDGMDSIDVSAVDTSFMGHSYFGDNTSVIADMKELIANDLPPDQRVCLSRQQRARMPYWVFDRCKRRSR